MKLHITISFNIDRLCKTASVLLFLVLNYNLDSDNTIILVTVKGELSDSFTNYNNVGNTKVSVSIKKTYANKCTLSEIFVTEILKSLSGF